ncbi:MAG: lytic transglycosylase domain-containing protein [Rhodospirillales bacterium]|nr:lytic transglycosylase domain-containing protein [Rhodospirillales bacterium]
MNVRHFAVVGVLLGVATVAGPAAAQSPFAVNGSEVSPVATGGWAAAAVLAADRGDWAGAETLAHQSGDPVIGKLVTWMKARSPDTIVSFSEIAGFIDANPDWPMQTALRRRAEEALTDGYSPELLVSWFERFPPLTTNGRRQYAAAATAIGPAERQQAAVREAWIKGSFSDSEELAFLAAYESALTAEDHGRRVDRLLWDGHTQAAQRILGRLGPDDRAVADARIGVQRKQLTPEQAAARLPESLRNHPGFVFDQVRWYRRNDQPSLARLRLMEVPGDTAAPDRFWDERSVLARQAYGQGDAATAYRLAAGHGLTDGSDLAEAEWFAGWIALRSLGDPGTAARHFDRVAETARMPISHARGAYWAGRAREAEGRGSEAIFWYQRAAQNPTTYYGQLAAAAYAPQRPLPLPPDPEVTAADQTAFAEHELKRAADILASAGRTELFRTFLVRLSEVLATPGGKHLTAQYANSSGRQEVAVAVAKQAVRDGQMLISGGYPTLHWLDGGGSEIEVPLVLSIVRQESQFNIEAISPAGARGLMQLMPGTAREVADKLSLPYAADTLTLNPAYNVQLGQAYLGQLLNTFSGSYVFSLAGYNAGPGRVRQWVREFGDPRGDLATTIDWIEKIPFSETRNYVQRTIEGIHVYRNRLAGPDVPLLVHQDLVR